MGEPVESSTLRTTALHDLEGILFHNTHTLRYLHCLGRLQRLLRWDAHLPLPQELLSEVGDVPSCDGNVLYTAADDVSLSLGDGRRERAAVI